MSINDRVKSILKSEKVNITLEKFGERLGVKKNAISAIENGRNSLTDQMTKLICREFNVNEAWLRTGEGKMFLENDDDFADQINRIMTGEDDTRKNLFKALLNASDADVIAIRHFIIETARLFEKKNADSYSEAEKPSYSADITVHEAEAEYIKSRSVSAKKKDLPALSTTTGESVSREQTMPNVSNQ